MYRQTGPSKGNRRAPVVAPGRSRPAAQRGGGGNKAAGSPAPTAANSPGITISPTGQVVESRSPALPGDGAEKWTAREEASVRRSRRRVQQAEHAATREERQKAAAALAQVSADRKRRTSERDRPASVAKISSRDSSTPSTYLGRTTAGAPTKAELDEAHGADLLKVNKAGALTTPAIRQASRALTKATRAARRSTPDASGLSPAERRILPFARRAHREYPDIPISVLMAQDKQESGFDPSAVSSADAFGVSQFIPSTAESYGVKPGTSRKAIQSQVSGQAHLLHDSGFSTDPQGALSSYSGGYAASDYNNPILSDARANYSALDKAGNPKTAKRLARAKRQAAALGLKSAGRALPAGPPPKQLVKRTVVAEHAMREIEGQPYVWGGGHGSFTSWGKDCSGAVGYVLHKVEPGRMKTPLTSGDMGQVLEPGPGALTVFYNAEHTFLRLINRKGETEYWGTSVGDSGAGGLTRHPTPSSSYLAQYNVGHVPGMGKLQALQLGADPATVTGGGTSAGVTLGPSGTTATIAPGAGVVKKGKPGRSKRPIILTPLQRFNRAKRKLASVGAPISPSSSKSGRSESHPILEELKAKYGSAPTPAKQKAAEAAAA